MQHVFLIKQSGNVAHLKKEKNFKGEPRINQDQGQMIVLKQGFSIGETYPSAHLHRKAPSYEELKTVLTLCDWQFDSKHVQIKYSDTFLFLGMCPIIL